MKLGKKIPAQSKNLTINKEKRDLIRPEERGQIVEEPTCIKHLSM